MRDTNDQSTIDLLQSPGARRQAAYSSKQKALGRRQRTFWLDDGEHVAVQELINRLRASRGL
jgi:hypothetical protein